MEDLRLEYVSDNGPRGEKEIAIGEKKERSGGKKEKGGKEGKGKKIAKGLGKKSKLVVVEPSKKGKTLAKLSRSKVLVIAKEKTKKKIKKSNDLKYLTINRVRAVKKAVVKKEGKRTDPPLPSASRPSDQAVVEKKVETKNKTAGKTITALVDLFTALIQSDSYA